MEECIQTVTVLQKSLSQRAESQEAQELHPWRHERRADDTELPRPPHRHGSMCEDGSEVAPVVCVGFTTDAQQNSAQP